MGDYFEKRVPNTKEEYNKFINELFNTIIKPTQRQRDNYELVKKYPFMLSRNIYTNLTTISKDNTKILTYTKVELIPKGWRKAFIPEMLDELMKVIPDDYLYDYTIYDIKEKYGTLRWYDSGRTDEMDKVIRKYESLSRITCIISGEPATHITRGWIEPVNEKYSDDLDEADRIDYNKMLEKINKNK